ncbi:MAG: glycosyltransferase family 2 protein [Candidatus Nanopelagicales bacterium]
MLDQSVVVVVPVFNEETVVGSVVTALRERFARVVCVDDGSSDASGDNARAAGGSVVRHPLNLGQGAALRTGMEFALTDPRTAVIVTFDADGQHDPDDAVRLVERLGNGDVDIVLGSRFLDDRTTMSRARRLVLRAAALQSRLVTGVRLTDAHNGLRAMTASTARTLDFRMSGMAHASEIVTIIGREHLRYTEVPVVVRYTDYSRSKGQPLVNSINIAFDLMLRRN